MEGYLKIYNAEEGDAVYKAEIPGLIQLDKISNDLAILKIYFQDLNPVDWHEDFWMDYHAGVALSNYAVKINNLNDLDGQIIEIKEGFTDDMLFAMLCVWDGQPLNNNKIRFERIAEGCFRVFWTGYFGADKQEYDNVELEMIAYQTKDLVTPLCDYPDELMEYYNGRI